MSKESVVEHPNHYTSGSIETIDLIEHMTIGLVGFHAVCVGNIVKYVSRAKFKNGVEDIEKAIQYLKFLHNKVEGQNNLLSMRHVINDEGMDGVIWSKLHENYKSEGCHRRLTEFLISLNQYLTGNSDRDILFKGMVEMLEGVKLKLEVSVDDA